MGSLTVVALVVSILMVWVVLAIVRRPIIGIAVGLAAWAWDFTTRGQGDAPTVSPGVEFGVIRVNVMDWAALALIGAILFTLVGFGARAYRPQQRMPHGFALGLLGLWGLWVLSIYRGIDSHGLEQAVNGGRELLYIVTYITFGAVFGQRLTRWQIETAWFATAGVLSALAIQFVLREGIGGVGSGSGRALNGGQAAIVSNALVLAALRPRPRPHHFLLVGWFALIVLMSQQRTVWAATITAFGIAAAVAIGKSGRLTRKWARMAVGSGTIALALLLVALPDLATNVGRSSNVSTSQGTGRWRIESGIAILRIFRSRNGFDQTFGAPSGASLERQLISGRYIDYSPHNSYLFMLISIGVVGLAIFVLLYVSLMRRAWLSPMVGYLFPLVAGQTIFSLGYQIAPEQGLLLGLFATGAVASHRVMSRPLVPAASNVPLTLGFSRPATDTERDVRRRSVPS